MLTKWVSSILVVLLIGLIALETSSNLILTTSSLTFVTNWLTWEDIFFNSSLIILRKRVVELTEVINSLSIFFCSSDKFLYLSLNFSNNILKVSNFKSLSYLLYSSIILSFTSETLIGPEVRCSKIVVLLLKLLGIPS